MIELFTHATTRRARRGIRREWRLHVLSVFSLTVAFVCLGAALLVLVNLKGVEDRWAHTGRASIYLKDGAPPADVEALKTALERVPAVTNVHYVSSGQARADFGALERDSAEKTGLSALPADAFPASLEVQVRPELEQNELNEIIAKLRMLPAVEDVETYRAWTERLSRFMRGGVAAAALLSLVVFGSVLAVVGSTVRLALQRRKTEVEVSKLVGASDRFVKGPFVVEGSAQGAAGAAVALVFLAIMFLIVRGRLDVELASLLGVEPQFLPLWLALAVVASGGVLGATAAALGLRKLVTV